MTSYLSDFDFNSRSNSLNDDWLIDLTSKNIKNKTYNEVKIKEINNFYGYQCRNCLFDVWRDKNTFDIKLVQSKFCCNNCKFSYELKKNKNYSILLNYKSKSNSNSNLKSKSNSI